MECQPLSRSVQTSSHPNEIVSGDSPGPIPAPRTSSLAVWSLVLGVIGFLTFIPSLAAVICGHLAHGKIKRSAGALTGKGIATAGFVLGYAGLVFLPLLAVVGFAAGSAAIGKAKKVSTIATAVSIESAVNNFYTEYGEMPSNVATTDTSKDVSLTKTLRGDDATRNTRSIRFLTVKEVKSNRGGLDSKTFQLFDMWGRGYHVVLDTGYAEEVTVTRGAITETLKGRRTAVFSAGEDGVAGTADDIKTW
jgi:hypothetical protein